MHARASRPGWVVWRALALVAPLIASLVILTGADVAGASPAGTTTIVTKGLGTPGEIVATPDGNLWIHSSYGDQIGFDSISRVSPTGTTTTYRDLGNVNGLAAGPDGDLWFTTEGGSQIGRITAAGVISSFTGALPDAGAIVAASNGDLLFRRSDGLWLVPEQGAVRHVTDAVTIEDLRSIAFGPAGTIWFTAVAADFVARIDTVGVVTHFTDPTIVQPSSVTLGADGNIWFSNFDAYGGLVGSIGRITPTGTITNVGGNGIGFIPDISTGPDGNLWFSNFDHFDEHGPAGPSIGRITPAGVTTMFTNAAMESPSLLTTGADGNLWFTDYGSETFARVTPAGVFTTFPGNRISFPQAIAKGADGNLWFTNVQQVYADPFVSTFGHDSIGRVTPTGVTTAFTDASINFPTSITPGPDGNLWFVNRDTQISADQASIGRITPAGVVTAFKGPNIATPRNIVAGPDGNLWFTNATSIGRITPAGVATKFTATGLAPVDIAVGPDGNLWFTNAGFVGRITPAGAITKFPDPTFADPQQITAGPDGNLWFTNRPTPTTAAIVKVTTAGVASSFSGVDIAAAGAISAGPDGNLWFADGAESIGRITPAGVTTRFTDPGISGDVVGITAGPDGRMWFTDLSAVGKINTASSADPARAATAVAARLSAVVSWIAPVADPAFPVTSYTVTSSPGGKTCSTAGLTCTVTGLTNGIPYTFTVTATSGKGTSLPSEPTAAVVPYRFTDVPPDAPFFADIEWMVSQGITTGYLDGTFHPADPVARQAMAAFLYRFKGSPNGAKPLCSVAPYPDVPPSSPFCGEITWMKGQAITNGYPDGGFHPNDAVARQAMAAFLYRFKGSPNGPTPTCATKPFTDIAITAPFCGEIAWMKSAGISNGNPDGTFAATTPVSRQAMAAFLHRLSLLP